jgi:hypothetical protein
VTASRDDADSEASIDRDNLVQKRKAAVAAADG